MPNWKIIIPVFFVLLFICRYYDFFIIYQPIAPFKTSYEPTFGSFLLYNYSLKVVLYSLKFFLIALILSLGIFLQGNKEIKVPSLKDLIVLAAASELVFFLRDAYMIIEFSYLHPNYSFEDYSYFNPLSVYQLLDISPTSNFAYLFKTINLFELAYVICLILGLKALTYSEVNKAVPVALGSYGGALLIWILTVTFISLQ